MSRTTGAAANIALDSALDIEDDKNVPAWVII